MCAFNKLVKNSNSYVSQCPYCGMIEIVYKTSIIHIYLSEWENFFAYIANIQDRHSKINSERGVILNLGSQSPLQMYLKNDELIAFYGLLDRADTEIKAQDLLNVLRR